MKRTTILTLTITSLLLTCWTGLLAGRNRVVEKRTVRETTTLSSLGRLTLDNIDGDVVIRGASGADVEIVAEETIRARSREKLEQAKQEVSLEVFEDDRGTVIYVDGPFRRDCEDRDGSRRDPGYDVTYHFEVRVPHDVELDVKTVNGEVEVEDVRGDFDIGTVNGGLNLEGLDGSGRARTVNGEVTVTFDGNPSSDSEFTTINGEIEVTFQPGFQADLYFKTLNGDMLTDFDVEPLATMPTRQESRNGKTVIRIEQEAAVRVAGGGPEMRFENINGDIVVRKSR